ncbi:hypothetical protein LAV79_15585 [Peribacillus butanolivorans]
MHGNKGLLALWFASRRFDNDTTAGEIWVPGKVPRTRGRHFAEVFMM